MAFQHLDFDLRIRVPCAAQVFIDADGDLLAVADAVDDEARPENAIAAGEDAGRGGRERLRVRNDQAARADLNTILRLTENPAWWSVRWPESRCRIR